MDWIEIAKEIGFTTAASLDPTKLQVRKVKADAAAAMKLTARDMANLNVIDEIIPEPDKGAHTNWQTTMELLSAAVANHIAELQTVPVDQLPAMRADKFFAMTRDVEIFQPAHDTEDN